MMVTRSRSARSCCRCPQTCFNPRLNCHIGERPLSLILRSVNLWVRNCVIRPPAAEGARRWDSCNSLPINLHFLVDKGNSTREYPCMGLLEMESIPLFHPGRDYTMARLALSIDNGRQEMMSLSWWCAAADKWA